MANARLVENREAQRFQLGVPVLLRWRSQDSFQCEADGLSRDVSSNGIFVYCNDECPPIHTHVEFVLTIHDSGESKLKIAAYGEVVRVNGVGQPPGFGANGHFMVVR
jgi:hypothetical protein